MNTRYLLRRLTQVVPTVGALLVITFLMIHMAPGDPVVVLAGESGDPGYYELVRSKFGLDRPLLDQLAAYTANVLRGDLGISFVSGRPVVEVIAERIPATLLLIIVAILVSSVGGILLGVLAAKRPFGRLDLAMNISSLVSHAIPSFFLSQIALLVFAFYAGLFPIHGMSDPRQAASGFARALDIGHHLALPAMVLAAQHFALIARLTRTGLLGETTRDYMHVARAKGLSERRALWRHALPNALLPTVTIIGGRLGFLFSGAAIVEIVFGWPGLGRLLLGATETRDYPLLLGIFLFVAFAVVIANLITDLIYAWLDPRIHYE